MASVPSSVAVAAGFYFYLKARNSSADGGAQAQVLNSPISPRLDVVFVHGLGGDFLETWTNKNKSLWILEWLASDLPSARVVTYGYPNGPSRWLANPAHMRVTDVGQEAFFNLTRLHGLGNHPFVLVGHSIGGLVNKCIVLAAHDLATASQGTTPPEDIAMAKLFMQNLRDVVFVGTPHRGSDLANFVTTLDRLFRALRLSSALHDLQLLAPHMVDVNTQFSRRGVRSLSLGESSPVAAIGRVVVEPGSSQMGTPTETFVQLAGKDHFGMSRPESQRDPLDQHALKFVADASGASQGLPTTLPRPRRRVPSASTSKSTKTRSSRPSSRSSACRRSTPSQSLPGYTHWRASRRRRRTRTANSRWFVLGGLCHRLQHRQPPRGSVGSWLAHWLAQSRAGVPRAL